MKTKSKRIGIWLRVSTDEQAKGESPEHHEERGRQYAEFKDWDVVEIYHLEGVSGKAVLQHPEAQRMLEDIANGHITGLIFSKLSRLGRNLKELLYFSEYFQKHNADLVSLGESIDTSSPAGRLFYTLISAMAQFEREEIAERVSASVPIRAKLGKPLGGQAPFGYTWVKKHLEINKKEAPIRKLMFELFIEHQRKGTVCKILNERGYRTRKGAKFSSTTLERLLTDPIAKGMRRANYTKSLGDGKHWVEKPKEEWVFHSVPAIVTKKLWEEVNDIMESQSNKKPRRKATHLFGGLTFCHCGTKMYVLSNSPKYTCTSCRNKIPTVDLEAIFHDELRDVIFDEHFVGDIINKSKKQIDNKNALLNQLQKKQTSLKEQLDQLLSLQRIGEIPENGFKEHYQPVFENYEQLNNRIPELQKEISILQKSQNNSREIVKETRDIHNQWSSLSQNDKKAIIHIMVEKIIIEKDKVIINLIALPKEQKNNSNDSGSTNHPLYIPPITTPPTSNDHPTSFNSLQKPHARSWIHRGNQHQ